MLKAEVCEFTLPMNSSMIFGGSPAAGMMVGLEMSFAIGKNYSQNQRRAIDFLSTRKLNSFKIAFAPESYNSSML